MDNYTGKRLDGRYEIQEIIGVGGMAVVYKAYDNIDDRTVAVKILKEEYLANEEFRRRFKNESKAIAVLSHPNIVKVYDVSYGDRLQYIVMEYVEGITLKEYIQQQGRLAIKEAVHFSMQILRALQHAHDKGIVHRDIKPQNIMLLSNGNIKVADFGIARFSSSETRTMTDGAIGSVHYISPEQARGDMTDDKTDIYAVGVVMYEMLTGQVPFQADNSVSVALMQVKDEPRSPRELNSTIPVGLEQITMHAMRKNAADRYQSAAAMLLDIEEFKRNPSIKFAYNYFIDSDPTKHIAKPTAGEVAAVPPVSGPAPTVPRVNTVPAPLPPEPDYEDDYDDDDSSAKNRKLVAIIAGAIAGLVVVLGIFVGILMLTDVININSIIPGVNIGTKVTVESFISKNYELEIKDNEEYADEYFFTVEYTANSTYEDGVVCRQNPVAGQKVGTNAEGKVEVTLYVVKTIKNVPVPDVTGLDYDVAKDTLEQAGFVVDMLPQLSTLVEFGKVIRTNPEANTEITEGSKITIYYASDEELVEVPDITPWDVDTARDILASMNLALDESFEVVDSEEPENDIVEQEPAAGQKVIPGTKVKVKVSSGKVAATSAEVVITLPDSGYSSGSIAVYVNNDYYTSKSVLLNGGTTSIDIEGSGENNIVNILLDGSPFYSCAINFTTNPATITDVNYVQNETQVDEIPVPDVVGKTEADARAALSAFTNVTVTYETVTNPADVGVVLSQSEPAFVSNSVIMGIPSTEQNYLSADAPITIVVGQRYSF